MPCFRQVQDIGAFSQVRRHSGLSNLVGRVERRVPHYQPWEDRRLPGRQHTATAEFPHPREELVRNLALWEARGPDDYSFEFQRSCSCPPEYHMPVRISASHASRAAG